MEVSAVMRASMVCGCSLSMLLVFGALATLELAAVSTVLASSASADTGDKTILANAELRALCLCGAVLGGLLAVGVLPEPGARDPVRRIAIKGASSAICGVLFGPLAVRYSGLPIDADTVMAIGGGVAFSSVWGLNIVLPRLERWVAKKADRMAAKHLGIGDSEISTAAPKKKDADR